jgi:hypothetical protein
MRWTVASDLRCMPGTEDSMPDRLLGGAIAAMAAALTLVQLLWLYGLFSPAAALAGRNGAGFAMVVAAWLFFTLAPLVAAAIILLMTDTDATA